VAVWTSLLCSAMTCGTGSEASATARPPCSALSHPRVHLHVRCCSHQPKLSPHTLPCRKHTTGSGFGTSADGATVFVGDEPCGELYIRHRRESGWVGGGAAHPTPALCARVLRFLMRLSCSMICSLFCTHSPLVVTTLKPVDCAMTPMLLGYTFVVLSAIACSLLIFYNRRNEMR
jgi:hypothetical protein